MNSPIWVRENIGNPNLEAGVPYQDTVGFTSWLHSNIGKPQDINLCY